MPMYSLYADTLEHIAELRRWSNRVSVRWQLIHYTYIADSTARDLAASAYLVIIRSIFYSKISQDRLRPTL